MRKLSGNITVEFNKLAAMYKMQFVHANSFLDFLEEEWNKPKEPLCHMQAERPTAPPSARIPREKWKKRYSKKTLNVTLAYLSAQKAVPMDDLVAHLMKHTSNKQRSAVSAVYEMCSDNVICKTQIQGVKLVTLPASRP